MKMRYLTAVLGVATTAVCAHAQDAGVLKLPQDIEFNGPLSGPPQTIVLYGDPLSPVYLSLALSSQAVGKTRLTGTRTKFAPSQSFQAHSTSDAVRPGMRASLQRTPRERSTLNLRRPRTLRGQKTATLSYKLPVLARQVRHLSSRRINSVRCLMSAIGPSGHELVRCTCLLMTAKRTSQVFDIF
jgi:hypothetical protein